MHRMHAILASVCLLVLAATARGQLGVEESQAALRLEQLQATQRKFDYLLGLRGYEGTAIGWDGKKPYFVVYVNKTAPPNIEIPSFSDELETRKVVVGSFRAISGAAMGTSTRSSAGCRDGSLGIAVKTPSGSQVGYLTNAHVAAVEKRRYCPNGEVKKQLAPSNIANQCQQPSTAIGTLIKATSIPTNPATLATVDAAFVEEISGAVDPANACGICPSDLSIIVPAYAEVNHIEVRKCGSATRSTTGTVMEISGRVGVDYECGIRAIFVDQIVVEQASALSPFTRDGDSGSVAYGKTAGVLGLIFANDGATRTLINPMDPVLAALGVEIDKGRHCR